ncbi:hypothetical protein QTP88_014058 [Uroleucon formosanum]
MSKRLSITSDQKEALVEFMENHPDLRKGKFSINFAIAIAEIQWKDCCKLLNSIPEPAKKWQEWRKVAVDAAVLFHCSTLQGNPSLRYKLVTRGSLMDLFSI